MIRATDARPSGFSGLRSAASAAFAPSPCSVPARRRRHRITHFYSDQPQRFNGVANEKLRPGLYDVDVSSGFTLVDQGGSAAVYRIDLCWLSSGQ